jgi:hypothetical protein
MRMSLQATTVHQKPIPLARRLVNLSTDLESIPDPRTYVQKLIDEVPSSKICEQLEIYLLTGDLEYATLQPAEAFKAVVYATRPVVGIPVQTANGIQPSPALGDASDLPVVMSRPLLFDELLVMHYQDNVTERYEFDEGAVERVIHAPLTLNWDSIDYDLLGESLNKAFYWPQERDVPQEIGPWLTKVPSERTTLITGLKRAGYSLDTLQGLKLDPSMIYEDGVNDLGVCVLTDEHISAINDEIGLIADPYQGTIWFSDDGSFFKGTLVSQSSSGLKPGYYGGVKRPHGATGAVVSTRGSIMDSYTLVPWKASMNRQQTDYAGLIFPVREELPTPETFAKAALGFPPFIQNLNEQLISSAGELFRRVSVSGYAGKISIGLSQSGVQFIIRGPNVKERTQTMVWLFNPSLPVHMKLMKVKVQFIQDETLLGNLIQLNLHATNHDWIERWYIQWAGRDCDGDGAVLTADPIVIKYAVWPSKVQWHDTTQYKSVADYPAGDCESCIRVATERIRLHAGKIGVLDKLARRIHRKDPELLTWKLRVLLSEGIQRAISAQKKNSGLDMSKIYSMLKSMLPVGSDQWLFGNVHDEIDQISANVRAYLRDRSEVGVPDFESLFDELRNMSDSMPKHIQAAQDVLALLQEIPTDSHHQFKSKGRELYAKYQARASRDQMEEVLGFIVKAKALWRTGCLYNDHDYSLGYNQKINVVRSWSRTLSRHAPTRLLVGAMIQHLSLNLLSHILDAQDLEHLNLLNGYYLPVSTGKDLQVGMVGSRGSYAALIVHPHFLSVLDEKKQYRIEDIHVLNGSNWITRTSHRSKQSTHLIRVKEVR